MNLFLIIDSGIVFTMMSNIFNIIKFRKTHEVLCERSDLEEHSVGQALTMFWRSVSPGLCTYLGSEPTGHAEPTDR